MGFCIKSKDNNDNNNYNDVDDIDDDDNDFDEEWGSEYTPLTMTVNWGLFSQVTRWRMLNRKRLRKSKSRMMIGKMEQER